MAMLERVSKPTVKVRVINTKKDSAVLRQVLLGIEEEGVPYEVIIVDSGDCVSLSHQSAIESRVGVGIGFDEKEIALHFDKLKLERPVFVISGRSDKEDNYRALGSNAARLVKRIPFKAIHEAR